MATAIAFPKSDNDETSIKQIMNVNNKHVGFLIGKSGSRLKEIKEKLNETLDVNNSLIEIKIYDSAVEIHGKSLNSILKTEALLKHLISEIEQKGYLNQYSVSNHLKKLDSNNKEKEPNTKYELFISIPEEYHGIIIGKNGSQLKHIMELYQVKITFRNNSNLYIKWPFLHNVRITSELSQKACQDVSQYLIQSLESFKQIKNQRELKHNEYLKRAAKREENKRKEELKEIESKQNELKRNQLMNAYSICVKNCKRIEIGKKIIDLTSSDWYEDIEYATKHLSNCPYKNLED